MKQTKPNWKITVKPDKTGVCIRTVSSIHDIYADRLARYLERCLLEYQPNGR